jgi:putative phosphoribosyl transferase
MARPVVEHPPIAGERFRDRVDAGRQLGRALWPLASEDAVVLGLPRGGVVVAAEVARTLGAPLDVVVVRKLGVPHQPELAMGAIGEDGTRVLNHDVLRVARVGDRELRRVEVGEQAELAARVRRYRRGHPRIRLRDRVAVVVDDGLATGATARTACRIAGAQGARLVVLAAPVGPPDTVEELRGSTDGVLCLVTPEPFLGVGHWYDDFAQTADEEVTALLDAARSEAVSG